MIARCLLCDWTLPDAEGVEAFHQHYTTSHYQSDTYLDRASLGDAS